jgi:hypothetical protein
MMNKHHPDTKSILRVRKVPLSSAILIVTGMITLSSADLIVVDNTNTTGIILNDTNNTLHVTSEGNISLINTNLAGAVFSGVGGITLENNGSITSIGTGGVPVDKYNNGIYLYASSNDLNQNEIVNNGDINASQGGIKIESVNRNLNNNTIINNNSITSGVYGIMASANNGGGTDNTTIHNNGTITSDEIGISAYGRLYLNNTTIVNEGNITSGLVGISVSSYTDINNTDITNIGNIQVDDGDQAIYINAADLSNTTINNEGNITNGNDDAIYIGGTNVINTLFINDGNITSSYRGVKITASNMDDTNITNNGNITAGSNMGMWVSSSGDMNNTTITNNGTITSGGYYGGIYVSGTNKMDNINIINKDTIANVGGDAGIYFNSNNGPLSNSSIVNEGNITSTGSGIYLYSYSGSDISNFSIRNDGNITANSSGIYLSDNSGSITNSSIDNNGTIRATDSNNDLQNSKYSINAGINGNMAINNYSDGKLYGNLNVSYYYRGNYTPQWTLTNYGLIELPWNANSYYYSSAKVGTFNHEANAILTIGLFTGSDGNVTNNYSQLEVYDATIDPDSIINVNVFTAEGNQSLIAGQVLDDVINAEHNLTAPNELNVTDNSDVLDFQYVLDGNTIDLNVLAAGGAGGEATNYRQTQTVETSKHLFNLMHNIVELRQRQTGQENGANSGDIMRADEQFWFKPFYSKGSQNDKDGLNGFDFITRGFGAGYDAEFSGKARAGLALFYTLADVETNNVSDTTDIKSYTALLYGSTPLEGKSTFMYQFAYGTQNNEGTRYIDENDLTKYSTSDYDSKFAAVDLKWMGEYAFSEKVDAKPLLVASYRRFNTPAYQETGHNTDSELIVQKSTVNQFILSGGEIFEYKLDAQTNFITDVRVGYDFNHGDNEVTASFEANPELIRTNGIDNGGVVYNLGFSYETIKENGIFNLNYNLEGEGKDFQNHIFSAKYVFKF